MNVLVLKPRQQTLDYCLFAEGWSRPVIEGKCNDYRRDEGGRRALAELSRHLHDTPQPLLAPPRPDLVALRGVFGGEEFREPTVVNAKIIQRLEQLIPYAPLHIPAMLSLLLACQQSFNKVPLVLVFETAFFVDLPSREFRYAIDPKLARARGLRRYEFFSESVERVIADQACAAYLSAKTPRPEKAESPARTKPVKRRTAPSAYSQFAPPRPATAP